MIDDNNGLQYYYSETYKDDYRNNYRQNNLTPPICYEKYAYNISIIFGIFLLIILFMWTYDFKVDKNSPYKDDCLLTLTSTYYTENCL